MEHNGENILTVSSDEVNNFKYLSTWYVYN